MKTEGFVEIDQESARLLRYTDGPAWECVSVTAHEGDLWSDLEKMIVVFFPPQCKLNFVLSTQADLRILSFPGTASEADIIGNLQLKRAEYFNTRDELLLKVRLGAIIDKSRDVLASFVPKDYLVRIKTLCQNIGMTLGRLVTSADAVFGALERQLQGPVASTCLLLQVGYARVHLLAVRGTEVISTRTMLTGSIRELENTLSASTAVTREDTYAVLSGAIPADNEFLDEIIRSNRRDFLTHVGSLISELRGKKLLDEHSMIYVNHSMVAEPALLYLIGERFGLPVVELTGLSENESYVSKEHGSAAWLLGASVPHTTNHAPVLSKAAQQLMLPPRVTVFAALVLAAAPIPFLNILKMRAEFIRNEWEKRHKPVETIENGFQQAALEQDRLVALAREITADIDRRGFATRLTRHIIEKIPDYCRLEKIETDFNNGRLFVQGFSVDAETALRYFDQIKTFAGLESHELSLLDVESRRIQFEITAKMLKKG